MSDMATIGKIVSTHGVRGGLKVVPFSDNPGRVFELDRVYLAKNGMLSEHRVNQAFEHGKFWVISLAGSDTVEAAVAHVGSLLQIPVAERPVLPEGSYYFDEIIGLDVYTILGRRLGTVTDILQAGGNDVYVVKAAAAADLPAEILVPAAKKIVLSINLAKKRMEVDLPEGLL